MGSNNRHRRGSDPFPATHTNDTPKEKGADQIRNAESPDTFSKWSNKLWGSNYLLLKLRDDAVYNEQTTTFSEMSLALEESISRIQRDWITDQVREFYLRFTEASNVKLSVLTWNVQGLTIKDDLKDLIKKIPSDTDIVVLGLQEMVINSKSYLYEDQKVYSSWITTLQRTLGEDYYFVHAKQLIGVCTFVFAREQLRDNVSVEKSSTLAFGLFGLLGNKGAVSIELKIYDTILNIINCHLAAHSEFLKKRNAELERIQRKFIGDALLPNFVFIIGDLNYRTELDSSSAEKLMTKSPSIIQLFDQLSTERRLHNLLDKFQEARIKFNPSYKYVIGTKDLSLGIGSRTSSYTDRILFKGNDIRTQEYDIIEDSLDSDHRPVIWIGQIEARRLLPKKFAHVKARLLNQWDTWENEIISRASLDVKELKFGTIRFAECITREFSIRNDSLLPIMFTISCVDLPDRIKPFYSCSHSSGIIPIGQVQKIKCTIQFNRLMKDNDQIFYDFIHQISIVNGQRLYQTVQLQYQKCFVEQGWKYLIEHNDYSHQSIPKEIGNILRFLYEHGNIFDNLFQRPCTDEFLLLQILKKVDNDDLESLLPPRDHAEFFLHRKHCITAMINLLFQMIYNTSEPLISKEEFESTIYNYPLALTHIISSIDERRANLILALLGFFQLYIQYKDITLQILVCRKMAEAIFLHPNSDHDARLVKLYRSVIKDYLIPAPD